MKFIMELFTLLSYCIPFVTIPVFAVSAILMIRTFFAEQAPEQSKKRRRYLGYMLVSFLFFLPYFWGGVYFSFYCIPFFTIPAFVISAILMIRTYFVEQTPEESRKRRGYLGCMLVSFLLFLLWFYSVRTPARGSLHSAAGSGRYSPYPVRRPPHRGWKRRSAAPA